eukprot:13460254-Alexandrium_andersonii.AAC.1
MLLSNRRWPSLVVDERRRAHEAREVGELLALADLWWTCESGGRGRKPAKGKNRCRQIRADVCSFSGEVRGAVAPWRSATSGSRLLQAA